MTKVAAQLCNDSSFGPVSSCRHFDFTLTFENIVLTIIPSAIYIVLFLLRLAALLSKRSSVAYPTRLSRDYVGLARLALVSSIAALSAVSLAMVVTRNRELNQIEHTHIAPAFALSMVATVVAVPLSHYERRRRSDGGAIISLWLFVTTLLDACRARSSSFVPALHGSLYPLLVTTTVLKALMLAAESANGLRALEPTSREHRASFISRMTFFWLVPTVWRGFQTPLTMDKLEELPSEFRSEYIHKKYAAASHGGAVSIDSVFPITPTDDGDVKGESLELDNMPTDSKSNLDMESLKRGCTPAKSYPQSDFSKGLIRTCGMAFTLAFLAPVLPQLLLTSCNLTLPFLVSNTIAFAQSYSSDGGSNSQPAAYGWGLVGATALVYFFIAICTGQFYWAASKGEVKLRGAFVSAIYEKSQRLTLEAAGHVGGGAAANLMSVDVERFVLIVIAFHTLWSGLLTIGVGCYLLYVQLGLAFLAPLLTTLLSLASAPILSWGLGDKQTAWSAETDKRVDLTSSIMANAKAIKFSAYENVLVKKLLSARSKEISRGVKFYNQLNIIVSQTNAMTEILIITTFAVLAYLSPERFNINVTFTSLTLLSIIQAPLNEMGQDFSQLCAGLASLRRIESFLQCEQRADVSSASFGAAASDSQICAGLRAASYAWGNEPVLHDVTAQIRRNQLTMICGRVACGKSTLLQSLLGETKLVGGEQHLGLLDEPVAYVAQDVWLQEGVSIRRNIVFSSEWDSEKYHTTLLATGLDVDTAALLHGDETHAKFLSGGQRQRVALARAVYSDADAYLLDDPLSALDAETAAHVWRSLMGERGLLKGKTIILVTNALHLLHHADHIIRLEEGRVAEQGSFAELSVKGKAAVSRASLDSERAGSRSKADMVAPPAEAVDSQPTESDDVAAGSVEWKVYMAYLRAGGKIWFSLFVLGICMRAGFQTGVQYVLQDWAAVNEAANHQHQGKYLGWIVGMTALTIVGLAMSIWVLFVPFTKNVGSKLHQAAAIGVLGTSLAFFAETSLGKIVGRFSQDIYLIDSEIPGSLLNTVSASINLFRIVIILAIPAPYLLLVIAVIAVAYVSLQRFYMPSSRQLRRLELEYKSPLYTTFGETTSVAGLATIRALKAKEHFFARSLHMLDDSQKPFYYLWATRRWLQTMLNLLALIINVGLVAIVVLLRHSSAVGLLGVSLVQATRLSDQMNRAFIAATELEIGSVAVERVSGFANLAPEQAGTVTAGRSPRMLQPPEVKGDLELRNVSVCYRAGLPFALKNLSLKLRKGETLGVAGRSGSGKSTLLLALFRLVDATQGQILLDGQDIADIDARSLRNAMTIIPQTPLILAASVRDNLDPEGVCEDADIWDALQKTELADYVRSLPLQLETILTGETVTLSMGQRQVFSLARALLRKRAILVLDECSSSMDLETDRKMQELLRTYFADCTIVSIAHRIAGIIDADQILVLGAGELVELGPPAELLRRRDGAFRSLAAEQGCL